MGRRIEVWTRGLAVRIGGYSERTMATGSMQMASTPGPVRRNPPAPRLPPRPTRSRAPRQGPEGRLNSLNPNPVRRNWLPAPSRPLPFPPPVRAGPIPAPAQPHHPAV